MATSQNGYAAPPPYLRNFQVTDHTTLPLRDGATGLILCHFIRRVDGRIEDVDFNYRDGERDDWGYAYRAVRGYETTLSNHASGTAADINATEHPLGVEGTWTPRERERLAHLLKLYDGCLRLGEFYSGRVDGMHVEIDDDITACERVAVRLFDTRNGRWLLEHNPGLRARVLS